MFSQNGLSLDQAPPISVVFRFFFSGSLFGILAAFLLLFFQEKIFDPYSAEALIFIHTLTLGVMLSFMFAALFQMLPVIAGVTLKAPVNKANAVQYPFILGVFALLFAFAYKTPWLFASASLLLGGSILYIAGVMLKNLFSIEHHSSSSKGILITLVALIILVLLALYMIMGLTGVNSGTYYMQFKQAHFSFGLFGWIAVLIISISFQVIEMFYVTPSYPKYISQYLPLKIIVLLFAALILSPFFDQVWVFVNVLIALLFSSYALFTLKRLTQRKRPLTDATVWLWRMGMLSLLVSMLLMLVDNLSGVQTFSTLSFVLFGSFALSVVLAMFYKIIPFLTWFHLNSQGYFTAPMMHEVIHPKTAMKHLYIHIAMVTSYLLSIYLPVLLTVAALLTLLSFGWMTWQIVHAHLLYKKTQETGEKFDMGNMNV